MNPINVETANESRHVRGDDLAGGVRKAKTPLVAVEPMRVAGDPRKLEDPVWLIGASSEELERVPTERVTLTKREEPADIARDA
jgi:hypothetical protein